MEFPADAIGITSTIPLEVPLAAGRHIVDLNNRFILHPDPVSLIKKAEAEGFPRNCCAWIKGIYGLVRALKIRKIIFVTGGDCSNTHALMETLLPDLDEVYTFSYPYPAEEKLMKVELERFCGSFHVTLEQAERQGKIIAGIRQDLRTLDELTWRDHLVTGGENHLWLVSASDFDGNPADFHTRLKAFLAECRQRKALSAPIRLGVVGVPPTFQSFHQTIEGLGAMIVLNEVPRQFALMENHESLARRYSDFSYPYGVWPRARDIKTQTQVRGIHGIIHYTQSFCHRQIHDIIIRREVGLPTLTIEGESPGMVDQRTRLRIEGFLEILAEKIQRKQTGAETIK